MELLCRAIFGAAVVGLLGLHEGEPTSCPDAWRLLYYRSATIQSLFVLVLFMLIAFYLSSMFIDMFANAIIQLPSMHYRLGCSVDHLKYETCEL